MTKGSNLTDLFHDRVPAEESSCALLEKVLKNLVSKY